MMSFVLSHRMKECSLHGVFSVSLFPSIPSAVELAKVPDYLFKHNDLFLSSKVKEVSSRY